MRPFGKSLPIRTAYEYFGFQPKVMAPKINDLVEEVRKDGIEIVRDDFRDPMGLGCWIRTLGQNMNVLKIMIVFA